MSPIYASAGGAENFWVFVSKRMVLGKGSVSEFTSNLVPPHHSIPFVPVLFGGKILFQRYRLPVGKVMTVNDVGQARLNGGECAGENDRQESEGRLEEVDWGLLP